MKESFGKRNWLIMIIFGLLGQLAWNVENMYFNVFVYDTIAPNLDAVTLMVQLSGITATVVTLIAGVLSDKLGDRRRFISIGYIIWGITVVLFGFISNENTAAFLGTSVNEAVGITLGIAVAADCVMTLFGSTANDAAFNAWVTDNTASSYRGTVEGVLSILPLIAMLAVAGGFGILKEAIGYQPLFLGLGILITVCGISGLFIIKDAPTLEKNGGMRDILYGFRPSVVRDNLPLYISLLVVVIYGISAQVFMPYMIIYMREYLGFSAIEYSLAFGVAILFGAVINVLLGRLSDKMSKIDLLYIAAGVMSAGLILMYFAKGMDHMANLILFTLTGFVMITGYVFVISLTGSLIRDYTPKGAAGKLQGVRMVFSVLIPMLVGPAIGNAINKAAGDMLTAPGADAMTTEYIPAPEIYLVAGIIMLLSFAIIPLLSKTAAHKKTADAEQARENERG